jgi:hypothetical protein
MAGAPASAGWTGITSWRSLLNMRAASLAE